MATNVEQPVSSTVMISDALAKFFGTEEKEMLQTDALKRIWEYIKLNQLEVDVYGLLVLFWSYRGACTCFFLSS